MKKREPAVAGDYVVPLITGGATVAYVCMGYQYLKEGNARGVVICGAGATVSAGATALGCYNLFKKTLGNGKLLWD